MECDELSMSARIDKQTCWMHYSARGGPRVSGRSRTRSHRQEKQ